MKLFVPEIGTVLTLTKDWEFTLYSESRNEALALAANFNYQSYSYGGISYNSRRVCNPEVAVSTGWTKDPTQYSDNWMKLVILPSGTILTLDRIYIRKGAGDYSSLSFNLNRKSVNPDFSEFARKVHTTKGRARFWVKLKDANSVEFDLQAD